MIPRVTVLVAIYKAGRFLESKLACLECQTIFKDCEIVLLNCQNLDDESSIYRSFVAEHDNVRTIEYTDYKRLYSTWNDAIRLTTGEFITNSNCDDQLHPECLERLVAALDGHQDYGVASADAYVTDMPNSRWPGWQWYGEIVGTYPDSTAGPAPLWRRSLHDRFGLFPDLRVVSDSLMWHRWHSGGVKFLRVPEHLVLYYQAGGQNLETRWDPAANDGAGAYCRDLDLEDIAKADKQ